MKWCAVQGSNLPTNPDFTRPEGEGPVLIAVPARGPNDDLAEVVQAWPELPPAMREAVVAIVRAVSRKRKGVGL
jgi:hypothetical protein